MVPSTLKVPKLRQLKFERAIIECYNRRESSVEEALIEMYLAGVSTRRVEDITQALWGTKVSPSTVSKLDKRGPTETHALLDDSVAIDWVPVSMCVDADGVPLTTDQRGLTRQQGLACDAGAFEVQP